MLGTLANLVTGLYAARAAHKVAHKAVEMADDWFKLTLSLSGTAFITFTGTWGLAIISFYEAGVNIYTTLILGFASALIATSSITLFIWKRSSLTRGIPIAAPMKIEAEVLKGGMVLTEPSAKKGGK